MNNCSQILRQAYLESPERAALVLIQSQMPDHVVNYRHLVEGASGYTHALASEGIEPGQVIIIILDHGPDLVFAFFGAVLRGAIPAIMPFLTEKLAPEHYRASLRALFEITAPTAVITYPGFLEEVRAASAGTSIRSILISSDVKPLASPELTGQTDGPSTGQSCAGEFCGLDRAGDDILLLQHSSGTTGLQKGVALSHQAVFNQIQSYAGALHLSSEDTIVSWLPLYHDMGLIAGFILPILSQAPLVLMSPFDWVRAPYKLLQAVSRYHGTLSWMPNFGYNFCAQKIRERDLAGVELSSWRAVINCSEPMHWKSHQMFLERFEHCGLRPQALATCYAMAENVFAVTQGGIDAPANLDLIDRGALVERQVAVPIRDGDEGVRLLSAGRPIPETRLRVIDSAGQDLPERHIGEIALQSNCMLTGYYHRPDLTEKAFIDGWYLTGDLGYLADGELYITARKKDLIIIGGKNIYPQDLERLAGEVQGVHAGRVVAFGVLNEQAGTEEAVVVAESDVRETGDRQEIADYIRRQVTRSSDIALRHVQVVKRGWLIKTSSGKIARSANRDKYLAEFGREEV